MPVTTRARKRAQREHTVSQAEINAKHIKNTGGKAIQVQGGGAKVTRARGAVGPQYKGLHGAQFPLEILALPHVLKRINTWAMTTDDAVLLTIKTKQHKALCRLLKRPDCNLDGALQFAAVNGFHHVVKFLLPKILTNEEYNLPDDVFDSLREAAVTAASKGHLEAVRLLMRELQSERTDEHYGEFVFYGYEDIYPENQNDAAWEVLDAAAANGHLKVVELAAGYAEERDCVAAGERSTALEDATAAGYTEIVQLLEDCNDFNWHDY